MKQQSLLLLLILTIGLLLSQGCASNSQFMKYEETFRAEAAARGHTHLRSVRISFGTPRATRLSSTNLGECYPGGSLSVPYIIIDEAQWITATEDAREILINHELGHCLSFKAHSVSGIMKARLITVEDYKANRKQLLDELFGTKTTLLSE